MADCLKIKLIIMKVVTFHQKNKGNKLVKLTSLFKIIIFYKKKTNIKRYKFLFINFFDFFDISSISNIIITKIYLV